MKWQGGNLKRRAIWLLVCAAGLLFFICGVFIKRGAIVPRPVRLLFPLIPPTTAEQEAEWLADQREDNFHYHGSISGTVRLANGQPAAKYRVQVDSRPRNSRHTFYAITDQRGRYTIRGLNDHQYQMGNRSDFAISVRNEGKPFIARQEEVPVTLTPEHNANHAVDFVLDPGPEVTIRVHDAETGAPVTGFPVRANPSELSAELVGVTDTNGAFVYHSPNKYIEIHLNPRIGPNLVIGAAPGYKMDYVADMAPGQKVVWEVKTYTNPDNYKTVLLHGILREPDGKPVRGVTVWLLRDQFKKRQQSVTDEQGRFEFETGRVSRHSDQNGTVLLIQRGTKLMVRFLRAADTWQTISLTWNPSESATVSGVVKDSRGKPLSNVAIEYKATLWNSQFPVTGYGNACHWWDRVLTDASGRFVVPVFSESVYSFSFRQRFWVGQGSPWINGEELFREGFISAYLGQKRDLGTITLAGAYEQR